MVHVRPHIAGETPLLLAADTSFLLADFFGQLVLIYRCYLVWGRNVWAVILPILLALGSVSCGMAVTGIVQQTSPTSNQVPVALIPMGDATFSLSIICNFITTGLIVGRLWILSRGMDAALINGKAQSLAQKAIGIIIESGLLFFLTQFVFIVLFALAHPAQAIIEPIACQVYAISPLLILVRVGMGMSYEQSTFETTDHGRATHSHTNTHSTSLHFSGARMGGSASKMDGSTADYEMGAYEEQSKEIPSVVEV
ncbi:unnamed protein product [Mycena citricolor]|nr:unnamed protein product [Mycena citricolor]